MRYSRTLILAALSVSIAPCMQGQDFINGDLEGPAATQLTMLPANWQAVPDKVSSQTTSVAQALVAVSPSEFEKAHSFNKRRARPLPSGNRNTYAPSRSPVRSMRAGSPTAMPERTERPVTSISV